MTTTYTYDAFISYAFEDKIELANELCERLKEKGLKIWYAGNELRVGRSIAKVVHEGLSQSRYGIVLITPTYFEKNWTLQELYALRAREGGGSIVILPVLHNITPDQVASRDMELAERWALDTKRGWDYVVDQLVETIKGKENETIPAPDILSKVRKLILSISAGIVLLTGLWLLLTHLKSTGPPAELVQSAIEERISSLQRDLEKDFALTLDKMQASDQQTVLSYYQQFTELEAYYRNTYEFSNNQNTIQFRKYVEPATGIDFDRWSPADNYGFTYPNIYLANRGVGKGFFDLTILYVNTQPVEYQVNQETPEERDYRVSVAYTQPFRIVGENLTYSPKTDYKKHTHHFIYGLKPVEVYRFEKEAQDWIFVGVE